MAITKSTIYSASNDAIYSVLNDRSNVNDPKVAGTGSSRTFIYETDPLTKDVSFNDYPCIILMYPELEQSNPSVDGKHKLLEFSQTIIVRTLKDGRSNSRLGAGRTDMRAIVDDIIETFNDNTVKNTLQDEQVFFANVDIDGHDSITIEDKEIMETEMTLTYKCRFQVSS